MRLAPTSSLAMSAVAVTGAACLAAYSYMVSVHPHAEPVEARVLGLHTYIVECGAYDAVVVPHDAASEDDAHRAARSYVSKGCTYALR